MGTKRGWCKEAVCKKIISNKIIGFSIRSYFNKGIANCFPFRIA